VARRTATRETPTGTKELRLALEAERERYRRLLDFAPDAHFVTTTSGRVLEANPAAEELLGAEPTGRLLTEDTAPAAHGAWRSLTERVLREGRVDGLELILHVDRGSRWVGVRAAVEEGAEGTTIRWALRDLSARREVEWIAATPTSRLDEFGLARLLGRLNEGIVAVDEKLEIAFANPAAERLLGARVATPGTQLPEPWSEPSLREIAAALHQPGAAEVDQLLTLGDDRTVRVRGAPGGSGAAAVLVLIDVSERLRHERAEREFVANAAHELRTPLTAITSAIEVLQAGAKHFESERDLFLGHIEREAARLRRLAHSLLLLARAQAFQEQPRVELVDLRALLDEAARSAAPRPGVGLDVVCPSDLGTLSNREIVEQILSVLVSNAARFTEAGSIELRGRRLGREAIIQVVDTGSGVSDVVMERLGDRFLRADDGGFGLGLSIARQLAAALGSELTLAQRPGGGTVATLRLPSARLKRA
jgi:two-component system, OmpR family, phosphate regulon sensor histidine kinase PhoR